VLTDGRRWSSTLAFLVAVGLLALVAVGVDRGAAVFVGHGVAAAIRAGGSDVVGADVQIHGFPFLTQLASGSLDEVSGSLTEGSFGGYRVADVTIDAREVTPRPPWQAGAVRASGVVGFDTLAEAISGRVGAEVTVGPSPDDAAALLIEMPFAVLGATVPVGATAVPHVVDGSVTVQVTALAVGGVAVQVDEAPLGLGDLLGTLALPLSLPAGVSLRDVRVEPGGLRIAAEARDVALGALIG
jgi:hypothetical protein